MSRFIDAYLDDCVAGYGSTSSPMWSTTVAQVSSGAEQAAQRWSQPMMLYTMPQAVRDDKTLNALWHHWMVMRGMAHTFPYRDPIDHASIDHAPTGRGNPDEQVIWDSISFDDQTIGIGDGLNRSFQLVRTYQVDTFSFVRTIRKPVVDSVVIGLENNEGIIEPVLSGFSVDRMTGIVEFDVPPESNREITAGFIYDVEVRYAGDDALNAAIRSYRAGGFGSLELAEVRSC